MCENILCNCLHLCNHANICYCFISLVAVELNIKTLKSPIYCSHNNNQNDLLPSIQKIISCNVQQSNMDGTTPTTNPPQCLSTHFSPKVNAHGSTATSAAMHLQSLSNFRWFNQCHSGLQLWV